jgi:ABC-type branched-subunit amino acid transport system ATPase component
VVEALGPAIGRALVIADTAMILAHGDIALPGDAKELADDGARIERSYLGRAREA